MGENKTPEEIFGERGLFKELKKAMLERMLKGELTAELGYPKHHPSGKIYANSRNGYNEKTIKSPDGEIKIEIPRDRNGKFEPQIIPKNQTRIGEIDEKIISLYARGISTIDIEVVLKELYGVEISPTLISNVTDEVIDEVKAWQSRPLVLLSILMP